MSTINDLPAELMDMIYNMKWAMELKEGVEKAYTHRVYFRRMYAEALSLDEDPIVIMQDPLYYELMVINDRANFHMKDCMGMKGNRLCANHSDYQYYLDLYEQTFSEAVEDVMSMAATGNLHLLKR